MIFVFTVIAVAYACRILGKFDIGGVYTNYVRSALYLLLFAWWGLPSTGASYRSGYCTACA